MANFDSSIPPSVSAASTQDDLDLMREWIELVDQDGLCHVTDVPFLLFEVIEKKKHTTINFE